jgi:hypothetical protein
VGNTLRFSAAQPGQARDGTSAPPGGPWLLDFKRLGEKTLLSTRTLRRLDAARDIPGRVVCGRRVLFLADVVKEWVSLGMPGRERWEAIQRARRADR